MEATEKAFGEAKNGGGQSSGRVARQGGAAVVEFALVASMFLALVLSVVELGQLFFVNLTMQHAVREGARYAVTGRANLDPHAGSQQRYQAVLKAIRDSAMGYYDKVSPVIVVSVNEASPSSYAGPDAYNPGMFGGPGDIVVLRLDCTWPLLTPIWQALFQDGKYAFSVAATMRNENYP